MSPCSAPTEYSCRCSERNTVCTSRLRLQKMIALVRFSAWSIMRRSVARLSKSLEPEATMFCVTVSAVEEARATSTRAGLCRNVSTRRWISGGMVAEKNRVWRVKGMSLQMRSMSGMKPMSSMRSASSMTRMSTPCSSSLPRSVWSSRRPGVAISTSTPRSSFLSWSPNEVPPISSATLSLWLMPYLLKFSSTWAASSRVGSRMSVRGMRALARPFSSSVSIGRVKEAVLPVPVWARPSTSRFCNTCGMAAA